MSDDNFELVLVRYYLRNGVLRVPNPKRCRDKRQKRKYHKGYEIRLVALDRAELAEIRRALRAASFECGRTFEKAARRVVPVYGKKQVERFLALVQASGLADEQPSA